jgi:2-C-methyl-D-erythritol 4-phosphate cytidylyltransferase / 2-C-methyl-D-erythritol 2,4-cyclodiphosphate synthase
VAKLLVIVAAGTGTRLGRPEPKALVPLGGRPLLSWTLEAFAPVGFARTVVTAPPDRLAEFRGVAGPAAEVVAGGRTRAESVRRGFEAVAAAETDVVAVHDAARPFLQADEIREVLRAAELCGAAIAATPVVDTVKRVADGRVVETVDRSELHGAATPQAFRASILRRALASGEEATDEAALCERLGLPVAVVPVSRLSFKITTPEDLELADAIVARRRR